MPDESHRDGPTSPRGAKQEIERKFLVDRTPDNIDAHPSHRIAQGYLAVGIDGSEVRLRRIDSRFFLTVKSGKGLARAETEIELSSLQFESLWPCTEGRRVEKDRFDLPFEHHKIELDRYRGDLSGLITAEIEFDTIEDSSRFTPPPWFGTEVTESERYKNRNLALHGMPQEDESGKNALIIYEQSCAVPFRYSEGRAEILLITSRGGKRWIVPKGLVEEGLTPGQSATHEAFEEAGVRGQLGETIGQYESKKWEGICRVTVFPLQVEAVLESWPEATRRQRRWMPVAEAVRIVRPKVLRDIIGNILEWKV